MTLQEPTHNTADAQGAFKSLSSSQSEMINLAEQERQNRQKIAIRNITERNAAKVISQSKFPIIIITEDKAASYGNLYKRLNDALPNIPVIFENEDAQRKFNTAPFCISNEFNHRTVGHLVCADDFEPSELCAEITKSDCIIVFGEPQKDLSNALDSHGDYIAGNKVNLSLIESMTRNKDEWKAWNKHLQQPPSI